jgi:hypothetical protein
MLVIGHRDLLGFQSFLIHLFPCKLNRQGNLQDLVYVRLPGVKDFRLSVNTVCVCKVVLLFTFETETDTGIKLHECAFVSLMWKNDADKIPQCVKTFV